MQIAILMGIEAKNSMHSYDTYFSFHTYILYFPLNDCMSEYPFIKPSKDGLFFTFYFGSLTSSKV